MTSPGNVAFTIGSFEVMWYGILIGLGAILGMLIAYHRAPRIGVDRDKLYMIMLLVLISGIVGARLYYVIFSWDYYGSHLGDILRIHNGGLAIHGGLIAGTLAAFFTSRHYKIKFLDVMDLIIPSVALGQAIGRWGNFFNSEAHGGPTDLPWAVIIDGQKYHPTFLYESIWCFILFIFLSYMLLKRRKFTGQILFLYGMLYSVERFFVESLRTDSLMIGPLKQAQVISICIFAACLLAYILFRRIPLNTDNVTSTNSTDDRDSAIDAPGTTNATDTVNAGDTDDVIDAHGTANAADEVNAADVDNVIDAAGAGNAADSASAENTADAENAAETENAADTENMDSAKKP